MLQMLPVILKTMFFTGQTTEPTVSELCHSSIQIPVNTSQRRVVSSAKTRMDQRGGESKLTYCLAILTRYRSMTDRRKDRQLCNSTDHAMNNNFCQVMLRCTADIGINPLKPTVAIWVQLVICNFWHPGTLTLRNERQSARMSKITNDG